MDISNKRQKLSGAAYKKKKKAREVENKLLSKSFDHFFKSASKVSEEVDKNVQNTSDHNEFHEENDTGNIQCITNNKEHNEAIIGHDPSTLISLTDESAGNEDDKEFDFFVKPSDNDLSRFLSYHPHQPGKNSQDHVILPFNPEKTFYRLEAGNRVPRSWISFDSKIQALFCYICLAFANGSSVFTGKCGFYKWKHTHERIFDHEQSVAHKEAAKAFIRKKAGFSIQTLLSTTQMNLRNAQVQNARTVVTRVIQVIKFLGIQGLAFRGRRNEAAYTLTDANVRHGNFLATILLLAKADPILKDHLAKSAEKSAIMKQKASDGSSSRGRGGFLSFLSNNTINKIIALIRIEIMRKISESVQTAEIFSIMMDSSTDVNSWDQCVFVIRFVDLYSKVVERLFAVKRVVSSRGNDLCHLLQSTLEECALDIENCVGDCFDGAANMNGQYNGVSAHLKQINSKHIHTWCHAHVLNLVISDTAECTVFAISLFGLLQELAVFFRDSYKRMLEYEKTNPQLKLSLIGKTRWSSKNDALLKVFGYFQSWKNAVNSSSSIDDIEIKSVFINAVISLDVISEEKTFNAKIRNQANGLKSHLLKFETILTAMLFLSIFEISRPVSKYLQTVNLDFIQAWRQVDGMLKQLEILRSNSECFQMLIKCAEKFIDVMNKNLEGHDIVVNKKFAEQRKSKNKSDNAITEIKNFEIKTYNVTLDNIITAIRSRFEKHRELYSDVECFDPRKFNEIVKNGLPIHALDTICNLTGTDKEEVREELLSFAGFFPELSSQTFDSVQTSGKKNYDSRSRSDRSSSESENQFSQNGYSEITHDRTEKCNHCLGCVYTLLFDYRMYVSEYNNLFRIYKFLLTLPMTQVSCERAFSKMKLIKID